MEVPVAKTNNLFVVVLQTIWTTIFCCETNLLLLAHLATMLRLACGLKCGRRERSKCECV